MTVSLVAFLILEPLLRQFSNTIEKASYVILVDNSLSVTETMDSSSIGVVNTALSDLQSGLEEQGYEVQLRGLEEGEELVFDQKSTNLSSTLDDIEEKWAGTHLAGVILASDGIYNRGTSPTYKNYSFPVYSIGLGDSIPKADLNLQNVFYNNNGYSGGNSNYYYNGGYYGGSSTQAPTSTATVAATAAATAAATQAATYAATAAATQAATSAATAAATAAATYAATQKATSNHKNS